ncbi:MAG: HEPN domain-containing protein [Deltaproteobacteria bacterium]|nr:HEPN domain-containing protein [Deltaproteobacteria bacterium]
MTNENQKHNAKLEIARAHACLDEAKTLVNAEFPYGAASRAYYAVFHAIRALLFSRGIEVHSHRAAFNLLGEHFVCTGLINSELARQAAHMQRDREDADYMTSAVFTTDEAEVIVTEAQQFLTAAEQILVAS